MELYLLVGVYTILFFIVTWKKFSWGLGLLIVTLPTYLVRFSLGPFPTTLLEISFLLLLAIWLIKYAKRDSIEIKLVLGEDGVFFILLALFVISSLVSIFIGDSVVKSLGIWRAYFLEPVILFFILLGRRRTLRARTIVWFLAVSCLSVALLACVQFFTGWGIATAEWTAVATRRVTSFFTSPNAVGLYLGPVILLMVGSLYRWKKYLLSELVDYKPVTTKIKNFFILIYQQKKMHGKYILMSLFTLLSLAALFFTKSEGAWVAVAGGLAVFFFLVGYKKTIFFAVFIGMILALNVPKLRTALLFQDQPGQNRLKLWSYSWDYLNDSPKQFVLGAGLRQFFDKIQKPRNDFKKIEPLIYPHSIVFNFWTETGLVGMISFLGILVYAFYRAFQVRKYAPIWGSTLAALLVVIIIHGLVDVPYFKNDLAMMFWIMMSLFFEFVPQRRLAI
jgi:O-antigen ligase